MCNAHCWTRTNDHSLNRRSNPRITTDLIKNRRRKITGVFFNSNDRSNPPMIEVTHDFTVVFMFERFKNSCLPFMLKTAYQIPLDYVKLNLVLHTPPIRTPSITLTLKMYHLLSLRYYPLWACALYGLRS